jgi:hypothetical protein
MRHRHGTQAYVTSEWVINEAAEARRRGILIPLLLDDVEVPLEFNGCRRRTLSVGPATRWRRALM